MTISAAVGECSRTACFAPDTACVLGFEECEHLATPAQEVSEVDEDECHGLPWSGLALGLNDLFRSLLSDALTSSASSARPTQGRQPSWPLTGSARAEDLATSDEGLQARTVYRVGTRLLDTCSGFRTDPVFPRTHPLPTNGHRLFCT